LVVLTAPAEFKGGSSRTRNSGGMDYIFSYPLFRELEKRPQGVTGVAAFFPLDANLSIQKQTVPSGAMIVSGGYFPLLGVRPLIGRTIEPADDSGSGNAVAVLSYGYWTWASNMSPWTARVSRLSPGTVSRWRFPRALGSRP
jgi:hypothetical protein